jgi:hypothetical protein
MRKKEEVKVLFTRNYTPRKAGEIAVIDKRLADFYIGAGVAHLHNCDDCNDAEPCAGCGGQKEAEAEPKTAKSKKGKIDKNSFK